MHRWIVLGLVLIFVSTFGRVPGLAALPLTHTEAMAIIEKAETSFSKGEMVTFARTLKELRHAELPASLVLEARVIDLVSTLGRYAGQYVVMQAYAEAEQRIDPITTTASEYRIEGRRAHEAWVELEHELVEATEALRRTYRGETIDIDFGSVSTHRLQSSMEHYEEAFHTGRADALIRQSYALLLEQSAIVNVWEIVLNRPAEAENYLMKGTIDGSRLLLIVGKRLQDHRDLARWTFETVIAMNKGRDDVPAMEAVEEAEEMLEFLGMVR